MRVKKTAYKSSFLRINTKLSPNKSASRISIIYLIYGVLWILTTDRLLEILFGDSQTYHTLQTFKGWIFVGLTALFMYWLVISTLRLYQEAKDRVQDAKENLEKQYLKTLESEQRFELAVKGNNDSIWEYDGKKKSYYMSSAILFKLGYSEDEINLAVLEDWIDFIYKEDKQLFMDQIQHFNHRDTDIFELTYRVVRKDQTLAWIRTRGTTLVSSSGELLKLAGSHTDISLLIKHQEELSKIAYFDGLTNLLNWNGFDKNVSEHIQTFPEKAFTLIYLDIDDFKYVNDFYGYAFGNKMLVQIANSLSVDLHENETLANLGGDGFGLFIDSIDKNYVLSRINSLLTQVKEIKKIDDYSVDVELSLGVTTYPNDGIEFSTLLHNADEAMHVAKRNGKNTYVFYSKKLHQKHMSNITMTNQLRKAVENNELHMVYQPIYQLSNQSISSLEALLRWQPKQGTNVSPELFIPLAENTGLIEMIERWVFKECFEQILKWRSVHSSICPVAINLSSKGIVNDSFVEYIIEQMDQYGILAKEFEIEITETSLIDRPEIAFNNLNKLKTKGISIHLDDFGKDYSSLSYLVDLPIDIIKIDKSFTQKIGISKPVNEVINHIISLAHSLNLKVIVEGIEDNIQKTFLASIGADFGQGYYLSKPSSVSEIETVFIN